MNFNQIRFLVILILSGCFAFWVFNIFSGPEAITYILNNYTKLWLLIFAHLPSLIFDSLAWMVLMTKKKLKFFWCFCITWISQTSGKFLPTGNITGEFVRIYLGVQKGMSSTNSSSTVIADLAIATFSLLLVSILSFSLFWEKKENLSQPEEGLEYILLSIFFMILASILFCFSIRKRFLKYILKKTSNYFIIYKKKIRAISISLLKFDYELYKLSFRINILLYSLFFRLLGWLGGAFEIYIFLRIINIEISPVDAILIESFTGIIRAFVFFIPAAIGVQEFAFVIVGTFLGFSNPVSLSIAISRRVREVLIGIPAMLSWYLIFNKKSNVD